LKYSGSFPKQKNGNENGTDEIKIQIKKFVGKINADFGKKFWRSFVKQKNERNI
jgi:hypothetical protein